MLSDNLLQLNLLRGKFVRRIRPKLWSRCHRGITVGKSVTAGRGCRLIIGETASLVLRDGCEIDDGSTLAAYGTAVVDIGRGAFIGHHCTIAARSNVTVGEGSYLAELVSIRDHDHAVGLPPSSGQMTVDPVDVGSDVWIGAKATVLRGTRIGDGAVIGANAVVKGVVRPRMVYAGVPARPIRPIDGNSPETPREGKR